MTERMRNGRGHAPLTDASINSFMPAKSELGAKLKATDVAYAHANLAAFVLAERSGSGTEYITRPSGRVGEWLRCHSIGALQPADEKQNTPPTLEMIRPLPDRIRQTDGAAAVDE